MPQLDGSASLASGSGSISMCARRRRRGLYRLRGMAELALTRSRRGDRRRYELAGFGTLRLGGWASRWATRRGRRAALGLRAARDLAVA